MLLELMHRLKFSRQLPQQPRPLPHIPPHHQSGCAEGKILNQIDVGKKLLAAAAGPGLFLSTPRKERILNAGLGILLAEPCLGSGMSDFSFGQTDT